MSIRIDATGQDDYILDDRQGLYASFGRGNSDQPEVHLSFVDPAFGDESFLGWYRLSDLQSLVDAARTHYENGDPL